MLVLNFMYMKKNLFRFSSRRFLFSTVMAYASPEADCERIAKAMVDVFAANNEHACYHILDLDTDGVKKV